MGLLRFALQQSAHASHRHGIDLVEVSRIQRMLDEHQGRMLEKLFTPVEQAECLKDVRSAARFAARFAAKEAAMKALGTGWPMVCTGRMCQLSTMTRVRRCWLSRARRGTGGQAGHHGLVGIANTHGRLRRGVGACDR